MVPMTRRRLLSICAGPLLAVLVGLFGPDALSLSGPAFLVLSVGLWMAVWWVTEAVPLAVTALLPLILFPALGLLTPREASAPYADKIIFLFLGGFLLARAVEKSELHRRIALRLIVLTGTGPRQVVGGFMLAGATLSMWISNTATAMMMLPVALAVARRARDASQNEEEARRFERALLLGIAYSTSIGGVGTLIGTPPNLVLAAAADELLGRPIDFAQWLLVGIPLVLLILPMAWFYLTKVAYRLPWRSENADEGDLLRDELRGLGRPSPKEWFVLLLFVCTAMAWVFRSTKQIGSVTIPGLVEVMPGIDDSTIAIAAAVLLFAIPGGRPNAPPVLTWADTKEIPWGVILLFGGGLSLARAVGYSGLDDAIGQAIASGGDLPILAMVTIVVVATVFVTELTSNTATASMLMPILAAAAVACGRDPLALMMAGAVSCSFAFCLPVATPPNAVVYGSGRLEIGEMVRAGVAMNVIATVLWLVLFFWVAAPLLGLDPSSPGGP